MANPPESGPSQPKPREVTPPKLGGPQELPVSAPSALLPTLSIRDRDMQCGQIYHIYQESHQDESIFAGDYDRIWYIERLFALAAAHSVRVHNFCLLPTTVHLVLEQDAPNGIAKMLQLLRRRYAVRRNKQLGISGNFWGQNFASQQVPSERHYQALHWYIEQLPVKQGKVKKAIQYKWSGAQAHAQTGSMTVAVKYDSTTFTLYMKHFEAVCQTREWQALLASGNVEVEMAQELQEIESITDGKARVRAAQAERAQRHQNARRKQAFRLQEGRLGSTEGSTEGSTQGSMGSASDRSTGG